MTARSNGKFVDVEGLSYVSGRLSGKTGVDGRFGFFEEENVVFSIGNLELGRAKGKPFMSIVDIVANPSLTNPNLINRARLLFSLTQGLGFEQGIKIDDKISSVVSKYAAEINLDAEEPSDLDSVLQKIGEDLGFVIKTVPHVRNHLRRSLDGLRVLRDIRIPLRDGNYVLADLFLPYNDSPVPALVSSNVYGKRVVYSGPRLDDPKEQAEFERIEDHFYSTSDNSQIEIPNTGNGYFFNWTKQRVYETASTLRSLWWVPRGYAMVKIDPRGVGQTPGRRGLFISDQETDDIFDAVEWAANQTWSNGSVALTGNSYGANCQWPVAALKPKGLKCIVPYGTEVDLYRDFAYVGGISTRKFADLWRKGVRAASPRWEDEFDIVETFAQHPFYDEYWEMSNVKLRDIDVPVFVAAAQMLLFHHRASFEAFRSLKDVHLHICDTNYYSWQSREAVHKVWAFLEHHLKGNKTLDIERVGLQMRIGHGDWYWRSEDSWEIPGTEYIDWHFNADGTLTSHPASSGKMVEVLSYAADVEPQGDKAGLTFLTPPFEKDVELAGHFTATLNISSTANDADIVVSIWALDDSNNLVRFCVVPNLQPLVCGQLKASHRKLDPEKSLPWRPWHTHKKEDYAPLVSGEIVEVNVEICPATARIKAGWRLRVDIIATESQPDIMGFNAIPGRVWEPSIHDGQTYSVHLGGQYQNFLKVPVVPLKDIGPLNLIP